MFFTKKKNSAKNSQKEDKFSLKIKLRACVCATVTNTAPESRRIFLFSFCEKWNIAAKKGKWMEKVGKFCRRIFHQFSIVLCFDSLKDFLERFYQLFPAAWSCHFHAAICDLLLFTWHSAFLRALERHSTVSEDVGRGCETKVESHHNHLMTQSAFCCWPGGVLWGVFAVGRRMKGFTEKLLFPLFADGPQNVKSHKGGKILVLSIKFPSACPALKNEKLQVTLT